MVLDEAEKEGWPRGQETESVDKHVGAGLRWASLTFSIKHLELDKARHLMLRTQLPKHNTPLSEPWPRTWPRTLTLVRGWPWAAAPVRCREERCSSAALQTGAEWCSWRPVQRCWSGCSWSWRSPCSCCCRRPARTLDWGWQHAAWRRWRREDKQRTSCQVCLKQLCQQTHNQNHRGAANWTWISSNSLLDSCCLGPCGTLWDPVGPCETLWDPVRPCGTLWDPTGSLSSGLCLTAY